MGLFKIIFYLLLLYTPLHTTANVSPLVSMEYNSTTVSIKSKGKFRFSSKKNKSQKKPTNKARKRGIILISIGCIVLLGGIIFLLAFPLSFYTFLIVAGILFWIISAFLIYGFRDLDFRNSPNKKPTKPEQPVQTIEREIP